MPVSPIVRLRLATRLATALAITLAMGACSFGPAPIAAVTPSTAQGSASATRIAPPPVTPPAAPGDNLPAFACTDAKGGTTGVAGVTAARTAEQAGYDRFVLQFDNLVPTYTLKRQANTVFQTGASGQSISLSGTAGVLVQVHSASAAGTFSGAADIVHGDYQVLREAKQTEDFEGYVSWGLGLTHAACFRTFTLTDPARLVVDFDTTS